MQVRIGEVFTSLDLKPINFDESEFQLAIAITTFWYKARPNPTLSPRTPPPPL